MTELRASWPTVRRQKRPVPQRVAMRVAYDGAGFAGFQRQPQRRTVEGELVRALQALGLTGGLGFASRTDAGVHADGQVIAFRAPALQSVGEIRESLQSKLPPDIQLLDAACAPAHFHPRWSAAGKDYIYRLRERDVAGHDGRRNWAITPELPDAALQGAAAELRGSPRLDGFTAAGARNQSAPALTALTIERVEGATAIRFMASAFRRYAIRHMVASLLVQARGEVAPGTCAVVARSPPPYRGPRAPAEGLTLERVHYPPELDPFAGRTDAG